MARILAWLLVAAITALTLVPPALRPLSRLPHAAEHAVVFFAMGAALALAYPGRAWRLGAAAVLFAAIIEVLQLIVPGRHAQLSDFLIDAGAACAGIAMAAVVTQWRDAR